MRETAKLISGTEAALRTRAEIIADVKNLKDVNPCKLAHFIIHPLKKPSSFDFDRVEKLHVLFLYQMVSRCAEQIYFQSNNFETIISILCSTTSSFLAKYFSLRIFHVVTRSGNRNLVKLLLKDYRILHCLQLFINECKLEKMETLTRIRFSPNIPEKYKPIVLAEHAVNLLADFCLWYNRKVSKTFKDIGLMDSIEAMHMSYKQYWNDSNMGQGIIIDGIQNGFLEILHHGNTVTLSRKASRDIRRTGRLCSNPACPNDDHILSIDETKSLSHCSRCRISAYCSHECQKQHWPQHKVHCKKKEVLL